MSRVNPGFAAAQQQSRCKTSTPSTARARATRRFATFATMFSPFSYALLSCLSTCVVVFCTWTLRNEDVITHIRVEMKQEQKKWATCKRFRKATTPYLKFFKREAEDISKCVCRLRVRCVCARFLSVFAFASCACSRTVASFSQVAGEQEAAGRLAARQRDAAIDLPVVLLAD